MPWTCTTCPTMDTMPRTCTTCPTRVLQHAPRIWDHEHPDESRNTPTNPGTPRRIQEHLSQWGPIPRCLVPRANGIPDPRSHPATTFPTPGSCTTIARRCPDDAMDTLHHCHDVPDEHVGHDTRDLLHCGHDTIGHAGHDTMSHDGHDTRDLLHHYHDALSHAPPVPRTKGLGPRYHVPRWTRCHGRTRCHGHAPPLPRGSCTTSTQMNPRAPR